VTRLRITPGPSARSAFRLGIVTASVAALAALGALYWIGELSLPLAGFVLVVLFPVYLVFVASVLSVWLGYDKGVADLRPVYEEQRKTS
jgi:hypothetical protein